MPRSTHESLLILLHQGVSSFQQQTWTSTPHLYSAILTPGLWRWLTEWQANQSKRDPRDYFLLTATQSRHPLQHIWQVVRQLIPHFQCTHTDCVQKQMKVRRTSVLLTGRLRKWTWSTLFLPLEQQGFCWRSHLQSSGLQTFVSNRDFTKVQVN